MINWITATPENIGEYLFKNGGFSIEKAYNYVFLHDDKTISCDPVPHYEDGKLFFYAWNVAEQHDFGYSMFGVSHFALQSEFNAILPKGDL